MPAKDKPGQRYAIVKYNGEKFTDLTPQIEAALQPSPTPVSTPAASKPEALPTNYKNLAFALAATLLIALVLYLLKGKKKSK